MQFNLKGVTKLETVLETKDIPIYQYSFDLRPKSFNFTQIKNIEEIISASQDINSISLCFENEKPQLVKELYKRSKERAHDSQQLLLEFMGDEKIEYCEQFKLPYIWHYHEDESISSFGHASYMQRVVFSHALLQKYHEQNELHGFLNLFSDYVQKIYFEVQLEWSREIILSIFDFFKIPVVSYEINSDVEHFYQNPDHKKIKQYYDNLSNLLKN